MRESGILIDGECDRSAIAELVNTVSNVDDPGADYIVRVDKPIGTLCDLLVDFYSGYGDVDQVTARTARAISDTFPDLSVNTMNEVGCPIPF